jgi:DNA-binding CsgD family transcriptional regulator
VDAGERELERGRDAFARHAWSDAHELLTAADSRAALAASDVELAAVAAFMLGRDNEFVAALERAHHLHLEARDRLPAARCAFWIGVFFLIAEELGPAMGWLGRAQRLVDAAGPGSVEAGYLLVPAMIEQEETGDYETARTTAREAVAIAERFGDADLAALARHVEGRAVAKLGRVEEGLRLLDEAMVAAMAGELSPIVTGLIYCSVIEGCHHVFALRRAREWTTVLSRWCEEQPDMVAFTGNCLAHRAEIMQLQGDWDGALEEARRARRRFVAEAHRPAIAQTAYQQAELLRLRGELAAAERSYRDATEGGWEPQPGLALLRLAQGNAAAANAGIRRAVGETSDPLRRARLLPAYVEILLAVGDVDEARAACAELAGLGDAYGNSGWLAASSAQAQGAVELAAGDPWAALASLRRARTEWQALEAPYEDACARVLVARACLAVGDDDTAALELSAARRAFTSLGAATDLARVEGFVSGAAKEPPTHGLSPRELEVLRLVAAGRSNREIAAALVISEHTVARHVQNIFAKLRVSTRTAAGAFAYEHGLAGDMGVAGSN